MNRFKTLYQIGNGTYGTVSLAQKLSTGEKVAIKRMKRKFYSWHEAMSLNEVKSLKQLHHRNVIRLKEVIREHNILYFIFEYMDQNLYEVMHTRRYPFAESTISYVVYQILQGLTFIHSRNFFHRDLKPENIMCSDGVNIVKIADLGLSKETFATPPYTDYVSTRWYRAPEVLLHSKHYDSSIDLWAVGCIICELYMLRPLFPGNSESDQLYRIFSILGTPSQKQWPKGYTLAKSVNYNFPNCRKQALEDNFLKNASYSAIYFIEKTFSWNPLDRPTAQQLLRNNYFCSAKNKYFSNINDLTCRNVKTMATEPVKPISLESPQRNMYERGSIFGSKESNSINNVEELLVPLTHLPKTESRTQFLSTSRLVDDTNTIDRDVYNFGVELIDRASKNSKVSDNNVKSICKLSW